MKSWSPGQIIEADALNDIEQGILNNSNNIQNINDNFNNLVKINYISINTMQKQSGDYVKVLNKTWTEIRDSLNNGQIAIAVEKQNDNLIYQYLVKSVSTSNNRYTIIINDLTYITENGPDNYPMYNN